MRLWLLRGAQFFALLTLTLTVTWGRAWPRPAFLTAYVFGFIHLIPLLLTLLCWTLSGFYGLRRLFANPLHGLWAGALVVFCLWGAASQSWALMSSFAPDSINYRPQVARDAALQLAFVTVFVIAVASVRTPVQALTMCLLVTGVILALSIFREAATPIELAEAENILTAGSLRYVRPSGLLTHPNNAAGFLVMSLFAAGAWLLRGPGWRRWLVTGIFGLMLWALLLTFSRAAMVGLVVGFAVIIALMVSHLRREVDARRQLYAALVIAVVVAVGFGMRFLPFVIARSAALTGPELTQEAVDEGQIENVEARSLSDRRVLLRLAWQAIREKPLLGTGIGNLGWQVSAYLMGEDLELEANYVHNVYLSAWAELGFIGGGLYLGAVVTGIAAGVQNQRRFPSSHRAALVAGFAALAVIGFFDYYTYALFPLQLLWWGCIAVAIAPPAPEMGL